VRGRALSRACKKIILFDLDGTLATSKQAIDAEMAAWLVALIERLPAAVISGGDWPQFEQQLLAQLPVDCNYSRLFLLPTSGTKFYRYTQGWQQLYADDFTSDERAQVLAALTSTLAESALRFEKLWGEQIEDRGSQITFSALGQHAPADVKALWDADTKKRNQLKAALDRKLPEFAVRIGGSTSIDITKPGIDKAYGVRKLAGISGFALSDMLFIGDALYPGGNDAPVRDAGVATIAVADIAETKLVIEAIIKAH